MMMMMMMMMMMTGLSGDSLLRSVEDRTQWRKIVHEAVQPSDRGRLDNNSRPNVFGSGWNMTSHGDSETVEYTKYKMT